jgi:hypothetical protein
VPANAIAGTTVSGSVSESTHDLETCFFLSSSVPDPGHLIVRFAQVLRRKSSGDGLWNRRSKDAGARHASAGLSAHMTGRSGHALVQRDVNYIKKALK